MLKDIHTHHPAPQPEGIISLSIIPDNTASISLQQGQTYSLGLHPWDTTDLDDSYFSTLESFASLPNVAAIGECGLDRLKGAPWFRQLLIFKKHVELSESVGKPLIIHDVKAHDVIAGLRRDLRPSQPWVIHGFRGKPSVAQSLLKAGCHLSFGEWFNEETVAMIPLERMLAETDESALSIDQIIERLSEARGEDLQSVIINNTSAITGGR